MQTKKFSRGEDDLPWFYQAFREWQSSSRTLPSLLPPKCERFCPALSWCLLRAIHPRAPVPVLAQGWAHNVLFVPPGNCLMMPSIRGAVSLIFQGRQRQELSLSLGCWCPDVSGTDGLLRKQETWKEVSAFSISVSNFSCLSKHKRWISLCLNLLRGKGGQPFVQINRCILKREMNFAQCFKKWPYNLAWICASHTFFITFLSKSF